MSYVVLEPNIPGAGNTITVAQGPCSQRLCILYIDGPLRVPLGRDLRHQVRALLRHGTRGIVLDLGRVSRIDAAGVGELVRAYNMTTAAKGVLRIAHPTPWVRQILDRVGLFDPLSGQGRWGLAILN